MGTFGTNRIYSVGRMVKVKDRMRWGFAPAWVRFPLYLKCKNHYKFSPLGDVSLRVCEHVGASLFVVKPHSRTADRAITRQVSSPCNGILFMRVLDPGSVRFCCTDHQARLQLLDYMDR